MLNQNSRETLYFRIPIFLSDLCIHVLILMGVLYHLDVVTSDGFLYKTIGIDSLLAASYCCSVAFFGIQVHERKNKPARIIWRALLQTAVTYVLFVAFVALVYKRMPRTLVLESAALAALVIPTWHLIFNKLVHLFRRNGHNSRSVVIVGADEIAAQLYAEFCSEQAITGYKVAGYFSSMSNSHMPDELQKLGKPEDFFSWIAENQPDEVYCTLPPASCEEIVDRIIKECNDRFIEFNFVPNMDGYPERHMRFTYFGRVTIIKLREEPMNTLTCLLLKRTADIIISGMFLLLVYPLVCLFVWVGNMLFGNRGPLYFKQLRTGYNGKDFHIYKFRSMRPSTTADTQQATKDDPRKTKFGDFLRRSSIDELPQFINVFKGDMSIIGPRPHMLYHTDMYSSIISNYMVRHLAKPGITGWAQINGCRGETKTDKEMEDRVRHDIWYIEHWSPLLDIEIFFRTIWQVLPGHDKQAY